MEKFGHVDPEVSALLAVMAPKLETIISGAVSLPSEILDGYALYFSPEALNGIYENYPDLVQADAELAYVLRRPDMEAYIRSRRLLGGSSS